MENFKDFFLDWALGIEGMNTFVSFLKNLLLFETSNTDNSVIMAIRLKADIEILVQFAMKSIGDIVKYLSTPIESTYLLFKTSSNEDLFDSSTENRTLYDFFKVSITNIKSSGFRSRIKSFLANIISEKINLKGLLQFLFVPYNFELNLTGDLEEIIDKEQRELLNTDLSYVGKILDFLKKNISPELLSASEDIDIAFNAYELFMHVKFATEKLFKA